MMPIPETPEIQRLLAESRAVSTALQLVEKGGDNSEVDALVRDALDVFSPDGSVQDLVIEAAMRGILGEPITHRDIKPVNHPSDRHIFEVTAKAWMAWLTDGDRERAHADLSNLGVPGSLPSEGGALHLMALQPWTAAVAALLKGDSAEARRQFRRAAELSAQFGTETSLAVQWTFAASFYRGR